MPAACRRAQAGDQAAWAKVIAQGQANHVAHAISGLRAMPPRGGNRRPDR
jgi:cytochrome c5